MREYAAAKRLHELPSLLEFLSYLFAAGNLLAGPFFEARDFKDYIERKARPLGVGARWWDGTRPPRLWGE